MSEGSESGRELENRMVEVVEKYWQEHNKPLLLSQLGNGDVGRQATAEAGGLARFIETRLHDRVRLIQHEDARQLIGAIPCTVDLGSGSESELLERSRTVAEGSDQRFASAFWAAFRKRLAIGYGRWVRSERPVRFEDVRDGFEAAEGFVEVDRSYIVDPDAGTDAVIAKINAWSEDKGVQLDAFLRTRERESGSGSDSLLGQLLDSLDLDEMKRVTMPLDVVDKLRRRQR